MEQPDDSPATERRRLRQQYDALPKTSHGAATGNRHNDVEPEWIASILNDPQDEWLEVLPNGQLNTIIAGRVPECRQWIKIVFVGTRNEGALHSAYQDRRLESRFGGRPW